MNILTDSIRMDTEYLHLLDCVKRGISTRPAPALVNGLCEGAQDAFTVSVINDYKSAVRSTEGQINLTLIICSEEKECLRLASMLEGFGIRAAFWPVRDLTFYNITASHEYEHARLKVLFGMIHGSYDVVITTPDASLGYTIPRIFVEGLSMTFDCNERLDPKETAKRLVNAGYSRVEMVEGPGQFAIRGGIIDVYPPCGVYVESGSKEKKCGSFPIRLELFGDEIDRMGSFGLESQRFETNLQRITFSPARELIAGKAEKKKLCEVLSSALRSAKTPELTAELSMELAAAKGAYESGTPINFIDKYISLVYPSKTCLLDYFKDSTPLVMVFSTNAVNDRLRSAEWHMNGVIEDLLEAGTVSPKYAEYSKPSSAFELFCDGNMTLHVDSMTYGMSGKRLSGMFGFRSRGLVSHAGNLELLCEDLASYVRQSYRIAVVAENKTAAENLCEMLTNAGFSATLESATGDYSIETLPRKTVLIKYRESIHPYELIVPKIAVLTTVPENRRSSAAAGRMKQRSKKKKGTEAILSYADLEVGDYVVHEKYGIGQYTGIENLTINGVSRDYFGVRYAGSDRLFLPVDKLDMVSKYIGAHSDDGLVKLDRMSGEAWGKSKARAKAAVKEMAKELIQLYAQRSRLPGFAFDADDDFQRDFEAAFEYEETQGQLDAIEDIKEDMMKHTPMDRLLCGDVGYGKTEVALRAAYKAVLSGKQVAILVPTTILALQHYQTIQSRFRSFAVNCDMLSRFRTPKQIELSVRKLRRHETDIVVGTHRLLSKDIEFNDLGLLIVDEEQRFGVAQKEKLKQLSKNVDVLTLTATPIPRTLNMALGGIRDISVLDEAPGDRLPIQTYVLEDDEMIIHEAIRRELRRGGQVFYLHNVVDDIPETAGRIQRMHPEARVVYAHGKMSKEELEEIWAEMLNGSIDVLVCTTIIETGVDVPNANTLIVDNAHRLGLSQLHQIRGRVGRSARRAYAYFTYPKGRAINEIAVKRLEAIRDYTEFGSGFRIAMRDLEIRGAGNLLGASQHGHLDAVGYDMYIKLLNEAILEEKGELPKARVECIVSLDYNAFIPESYIKYSSQRMGIYKRIAMIRTEEDCDDIADELLDRYGEMPQSVDNLLRIALIRARAEACGVTQITQQGTEILIYPEDIDFDIWSELCEACDGKMRVRMGEKVHICYQPRKITAGIASVNKIFEKYIEIMRRNASENGV